MTDRQPPDRSDDFDRGVANRRAVLGDEWVDRSLAGATDFNADFQSLITRYAWHEIWGRPGLDHETRRLLVLGMTMGMARWEEFELHCRAAIRGGVPLDKIKETLLQGAIYCGVPAANTAFKLTGEILRAEGHAPSPQSLGAESRVATHHTFSAPQLRVTVQGQGPAVVLSHALGLDVRMWDALAERLASSYTVLRYDHRGHGGSARPDGPYAMDQLVEDAARVGTHLRVLDPRRQVGQRPADVAGDEMEDRHRRRREQDDAQLAVEQDGGDRCRCHQVLQVGVAARELVNVALQRLVDGGQLLDDGLQFLAAGVVDHVAEVFLGRVRRRLDARLVVRDGGRLGTARSVLRIVHGA